MVFSNTTKALFSECERLATELATINPNDELLFYSNHQERTVRETDEVTVLFIENFFPEGASSTNMNEQVIVLALSSFKIALERSIAAAPEMLKVVADAQKADWLK